MWIHHLLPHTIYLSGFLRHLQLKNYDSCCVSKMCCPLNVRGTASFIEYLRTGPAPLLPCFNNATVQSIQTYIIQRTLTYTSWTKLTTTNSEKYTQYSQSCSVSCCSDAHKWWFTVSKHQLWNGPIEQRRRGQRGQEDPVKDRLRSGVK